MKKTVRQYYGGDTRKIASVVYNRKISYYTTITIDTEVLS